MSEPILRRLLRARCRRYSLRLDRYPHLLRQSIVVRAPKSFVDGGQMPEFQQLNDALTAYLAATNETVIRNAIHSESSEAEAAAERPWIGR